MILQWNTNDFLVSPAACAEDLRLTRSYIETMRAPEGGSRLLRYLRLALARREMNQQLIDLNLRELQRPANFQQIKALRDEVERAGARFVVLIFPELIRLDHHPYAPILDALRAFCIREQIACIDLAPKLAAHRDRELWVHELDHHPNRIAHQIAADALAEALGR